MNFTEKILVVEDDQTVREYLRKLFTSKGYQVQTASRVDEALQLLTKEHYPVVVTDLRLPGVSGIEILDHVQRLGLRTAVLVVTAYGSMESVIEVLRRGAYDYIPKPFASGILLHRVARAMERTRMEEERMKQEREMATLFQMTRELSSRLLYATEEERQRISRDLHDGVGQTLSIMKLTLKTIRANLPPEARDTSAEIDGLSTLLEDTMDEVSRILKDLNPTFVQEAGFLQTLHLYLETFGKKMGFEILTDLPERLSLATPQQDVHLYRIAQEALTNIAKHSQATRVQIRLEPIEDILRFSISDNGQGFDNSPGARRIGLGLIGMRERVAFLGGRFQVDTLPGQGTTIVVEIPYASPVSIRANG